MKKALLIACIIVGIIFIVSQIYFYDLSCNIEQYKYVVTKTYDDFEIRQYESSVFAKVQLNTDVFENASQQGFSVLAGYIFGNNEDGKQIPMTSPVSMTIDEDISMMFLVPSGVALEQIPKPLNSNIKFIEVPEKKYAAIRFGGWTSQTKIENHQQKLLKLLEDHNIEYLAHSLFCGYNSPMELFFRKNEILIEVK
jgi:effector-binding domain-containing protein